MQAAPGCCCIMKHGSLQSQRHLHRPKDAPSYPLPTSGHPAMEVPEPSEGPAVLLQDREGHPRKLCCKSSHLPCSSAPCCQPEPQPHSQGGMGVQVAPHNSVNQ